MTAKPGKHKTPAVSPEPSVPAGTMCSARVHDDYGVSFHACTFAAKVIRNGKPYCRVHDPGGDTGERAYAVGIDFDGKAELQSASILKRTATLVILGKTGRAFDYRNRMKRDEIDTTPAAAWARFIAAQEKKVAALEINVMAEQAILSRAKEQAREQEE